MRLHLDQIESRLQAFIESSILFIPASHRQASLARQLVAAMQSSLENAASAASGYTIYVHPATHSIWQSSPDVIDALSQVFSAAAREAGVSFSTAPVLRLSADPALAVDTVRVAPVLYDGNAGNTAVLAVPSSQPSGDPQPPTAFLIIGGVETFPLQQPVVNLGRRAENHIAISDPRVSRSHAQIRAVRGRYVLFDLNSAGGTFVNGLRVEQWSLKPGDVISLAGVPIIYGEEAPPSNSDTTTYTPGQPSSSEDR